MFRGREMTHQELGRKLIDRFQEEAEEVAQVETPPRMEGRTMTMILAPRKTKSS
jgi:translation initiation factor IF-3